MTTPLLRFDGVTRVYALDARLLSRLTGRARRLVAVDRVDLAVAPGEILGLVGESGSGKSTLAQMAVRLVRPTAGRVLFRGRDVAAMTRAELADFRSRVQMVFQDSHSALNPRKRIGRSLAEPLQLKGIARSARRARAEELLQLVGLGPGMLDRFPHELSGGQRQRIGIARALAMEPELLVADEPVSSLDVSLQAQIINLLLRLREQLSLTILFISHDFALVNFLADRIAVMQQGRLVEIGTPEAVVLSPSDPYTRRLIESIPRGIDRGVPDGPISPGSAWESPA